MTGSDLTFGGLYLPRLRVEHFVDVIGTRFGADGFAVIVQRVQFDGDQGIERSVFVEIDLEALTDGIHRMHFRAFAEPWLV